MVGVLQSTVGTKMQGDVAAAVVVVVVVMLTMYRLCLPNHLVLRLLPRPRPRHFGK